MLPAHPRLENRLLKCKEDSSGDWRFVSGWSPEQKTLYVVHKGLVMFAFGSGREFDERNHGRSAARYNTTNVGSGSMVPCRECTRARRTLSLVNNSDLHILIRCPDALRPYELEG